MRKSTLFSCLNIRTVISLSSRRFIALLFMLASGISSGSQLVIPAPSGSESFGKNVAVLLNGNFVVTDPDYAVGGLINVGAVRLYKANGDLISMLTGSKSFDFVGRGGVVALKNGHYLVLSPDWSSATASRAGAATWCNGASGISGIVSEANSLIGKDMSSRIGSGGAKALSNGNYVVISPDATFLLPFPNGQQSQGAVTWGPGNAGVNGVISAANSLIGTTRNSVILPDQVGSGGVVELSNSDYVVISPNWNQEQLGKFRASGAVTWGSGSVGVKGEVSASNSLIGNLGDDVGLGGVTPLRFGGYVVSSPNWDNGSVLDAGAATWGPANGIVGNVTAGNSLVGATTNDRISSGRIIALDNGNYVVASPLWDRGAVQDAGAATWARGDTGRTGVVSSQNSLVGSQQEDRVAEGVQSGEQAIGVIALRNGNYVVRSPRWDNGVLVNAGAVTWGSGSVGIAGSVSSANSLVSDQGGVQSGEIVTPLSNGHYVATSPDWGSGDSFSGAATWGSGTSGVTGVISANNSVSLKRSSSGEVYVTALSNGDFVALSTVSRLLNSGTVTVLQGASVNTTHVSLANSLTGHVQAFIKNKAVTALANGNFVVATPDWDNSGASNVGAITLGRASKGFSGLVSAANSSIGVSSQDNLGLIGIADNGVTPLSDGNYVVKSDRFSGRRGAITLGLGSVTQTGVVTSANTVFGQTTQGGGNMTFDYDAARRQLVVGDPASNRVVLLRPGVLTTTVIAGDSPDPSSGPQPILVSVHVTSQSNPTDGYLLARGNHGEQCMDTTPTAVSATVSSFSCHLIPSRGGMMEISADFLGSNAFAFSSSAAEQHMVLDLLLANGFE